jgi:MOSC domain-containing protein YiiM
MTTLDPATSTSAPEVLRTIVERREECVGVYAVVLARGWVRAGDPIYLED